ncbi:MFS general substrate transporter [Pseudohyphozyma bogoriensis]|nr:MFS general substrate transporter [Pseudohyphozyma bogoriensis]
MSNTSIDKVPADEKGGVPVEGDLPAGSTDIRSRFTYADQRRIIWKADLHILPILVSVPAPSDVLSLAYVIKNLDASALTYAKTINKTFRPETNISNQLHLTTQDYNWAQTIYYIGFCIAEIPSSLLLKWSGPRNHFFRIIFFWSVCAAAMCGAKNAQGVYVLRFFLGLMEGGLYPAIVTYFTTWYRPDEIAIRLGTLTALAQFSSIMQALLTYGLAFVSGNAGLSAWQMTYMFEGLLGIVLCIFLWFFLPDYADTAKFLTPEERLFVIARLPGGAARPDDKVFSWKEIKMTLTDIRTWLFALTLNMLNTAAGGYQFWLPTIIADLGFTGARVQLLNIPPNFINICVGVGGGYLSDRTHSIPKPCWIIFACLAGVATFTGMAYTTSPGALYALICLANIPVGLYLSNIERIYPCGVMSIFQAKYAPTYSTSFMIDVGFWLAAMSFSLPLWYLTKESESDFRRVNKERLAYGKKTGKVYEGDVKVDERVVDRKYDDIHVSVQRSNAREGDLRPDCASHASSHAATLAFIDLAHERKLRLPYELATYGVMSHQVEKIFDAVREFESNPHCASMMRDQAAQLLDSSVGEHLPRPVAAMVGYCRAFFEAQCGLPEEAYLMLDWCLGELEEEDDSELVTDLRQFLYAELCKVDEYLYGAARERPNLSTSLPPASHLFRSRSSNTPAAEEHPTTGSKRGAGLETDDEAEAQEERVLSHEIRDGDRHTTMEETRPDQRQTPTPPIGAPLSL